MSKLIENKQIIHIVTEVVVIAGIVFYFSSKNKKLSEQIEDLSQRLEDQEEMIQNHEQVIRQLVSAVNNRPPPPQQAPPVQKKSRRTPRTTTHRPRAATRQVQPTVTFEDNEEVAESKSLSSSEDDSDLDNEIAEELSELKAVTEEKSS